MRNKLLITGVFLSFVLLNSCGKKMEEEQSKPAATLSQDSLKARGEYLVGIMGCNDCHSPKIFGPNGPMPDPERLLSGHPADMPSGRIDTTLLKDWALFNMFNTSAVGPWGQSFAANLTSDETGIGNWTLEQFKKALKEGKYKGLDGGRMLLPPMPWTNFKNISDVDVESIFTYLKSTKPVKNVVPSPIPPTALK